MKVAWVYPLDERCGISFYGHAYVEALREHAEVETVDTAECLHSPAEALGRINGCDLVHVQYEAGLYWTARGDGYGGLRKRIERPLVVSLHEVYREFPGVYPRSRIEGVWPVRQVRRFVYDQRHPTITAYRKHLAHGFGAARVVVHYPYQESILRDQGIDAARVAVLAHPVFGSHREKRPAGDEGLVDAGVLRLGSSGFVNPNFAHDQLFAALELLSVPWHFTWIGGTRRAEDGGLVAWLEQEARRRGWGERFRVTGWVDEVELAARIAELDIYLALFSSRSSSGSIMRALAQRRVIVARDLPLVRDLNAGGALTAVVQSSGESVASAIERLRSDAAWRSELQSSIDRYVVEHSFGRMAERTVNLYREILAT